MDVERIIDDIEQLEEMFEAADIRPPSASDISAANRRHDEMLVTALGSGCGSGMASVAERSPIILREQVWIRLSACHPNRDGSGRRSTNLSAYWKPSLLLLACAAAGTVSSTVAASVDTAAIAKTIKTDVAQLVAGLNAHDAVKKPLMTPRISSPWNVAVPQLLGSKPTERASRWALPTTLFGESVSSTKL